MEEEKNGAELSCYLCNNIYGSTNISLPVLLTSLTVVDRLMLSILSYIAISRE